MRMSVVELSLLKTKKNKKSAFCLSQSSGLNRIQVEWNDHKVKVTAKNEVQLLTKSESSLNFVTQHSECVIGLFNNTRKICF